MRASLLLITLLIGGAVFAQPNSDKRQERREKIHAQKIAFIVAELELTTEEAQQFWPVYNEYEDAVETIRKERKGYLKELRNSDNLSDERAYELFELVFATEKKESDTRTTYLKKFANVLGKGKAAGVFIAEEKFRRQLLETLKHDRHGPPPREGSGGRP